MSERPCAVDRCDRPVQDAYVCQACALDLERALGDVRWLLEQLDIVLTKQTAKPLFRDGGRSTEGKDAHEEGDDPGGGISAKPLPFNVDASEARWVLVNTVTTWARVVEEEHQVDPAFTGPVCAVNCGHESCRLIVGVHMPTIGGVGIVAAWLSSYAGWLRTHSAAGEVVEEVLAAVASARRVVDVKPERWYAGPCEGIEDQVCGQDLYAKPNAARVTCPACGASYDATERREWLLAAAHDHLGTAREIAALCSGYGDMVTVGMIDGYVRRGKVSAHGAITDKRGRLVSRYRVGDVLAAANAATYDEREMRATKRASRSR